MKKFNNKRLLLIFYTIIINYFLIVFFNIKLEISIFIIQIKNYIKIQIENNTIYLIKQLY